MMRPHGGFDHNAQSLKAVTLLETRYAGFDGLNLTWETLEGLAKHNGPVRRPAPYLAEYDARHGWSCPPMRASRRRWRRLADDIAYNNHDLDDGVRAGLFTLEEAAALPLVGEAMEQARRDHPGPAQGPRDRGVGAPRHQPHGQRRGGGDAPPIEALAPNPPRTSARRTGPWWPSASPCST
jgi:dGTPase